VAFTYDITTTVGKIRFAIGDTVSSGALLTDAEIEYCYAEQPSIRGAAIMALRGVLAHFKTEMDRSANGFSSSRTQRFQQVKDLLDTLLNDSPASSATFTGASVSRAESLETDEDYIEPELSEIEDETEDSDE
jgi:hypothetical protein